MEQKKKLLVTGLLIAAGAVLFAVGFAVLPNTLVMQITSAGATGTMLPKPLGLALPLAITVIFSLVWYKSCQSKDLILSIVGIGLFLLTFFMNL